MAYKKPQVIAQNASTGSYAAGCPAHECGPGGIINGIPHNCKACERTQ